MKKKSIPSARTKADKRTKAEVTTSSPTDAKPMLAADSRLEVTLNCTVSQLYLIMNALDLFSRIGIGQLEHVLEHWGVDEYMDNKFRKDGKVDWSALHEEKDLLKSLLNEVKRILFDCPPNGSHGIGSDKVSDMNRVAYDMIQVIRHELYKLRGDKQTMTVDAFPATRFSHTTNLVEATIVCR